MRNRLTSAPLIAGLLALAACDQQSADSGNSGSDQVALKQPASTPPAAGNAEVLAAMAGQAVGKKLLGKLMAVDADGGWIEAELDSAPDYYLAYYSASW